MQALLTLENITYRRGRFHVLNNLNLTLCSGEIHTLMYTSPEASRALVDIFTAQLPPQNYFGNIYWEGNPLLFSSPSVPLHLGIATSRSRPLIIRDSSLQENIFLAQEDEGEDAFLDRDREEHTTNDWLRRFGLPFSPNTLAEDLDESFYPILELIRVLNRTQKILILQQNLIDSLSPAVQETLHTILKGKVKQGLSLLYLCNNPSFLWHSSKQFSQLHRGEVELKWTSAEGTTERTEQESLIFKNLVLPSIERHNENHTSLVSLIHWEGERLPGVNSQELTLHCWEGERLALGGLFSHNKRGLVDVLSGKKTSPQAENLLWIGEPLLFKSPAEASQNRVGVVSSENRLIENFTLKENVLLKLQNSQLALLLDHSFYMNRLAELCERFQISLPDLSQPLEFLSGLEIQTILLVQALLMEPLFLLLEDPTLYLNQQDKISYFELTERLAENGVTLLILISSPWDFSLFKGRKIWTQKEKSIEDMLKEPLHTPEAKGTVIHGK